MQPMKPMQPMQAPDPWWPEGLGEPRTAGGQDDVKYAVFADQRRLAVCRSGRVTVDDTADHQNTGTTQHQKGDRGDLTFTSPKGNVPLGSLKAAD